MNAPQQPRRILTALAGTLGIAGWVLLAMNVVGDFASRNSAGRASAAQQAPAAGQPSAAELTALRSQLDEKDRALKKASEQLAPFFQFAAEHSPGAEPDAQLEALRKYFAASRLPSIRRYVEPKAVERLRNLLKDAPALNVEVGATNGDIEALALAEELRKLFESVGMQSRSVVPYEKPPNNMRGVSIYSRPQLDDSLSGIISEIFAAVAQEKIQWVSGADAPIFNKRDPDMRIFVGPK